MRQCVRPELARSQYRVSHPFVGAYGHFTMFAFRRTMRHVCAVAAVGLALLLPATAGAATVGTTKVYSPTTFNAKGVAQVYRFTAAQSGQVNRLSVYVDGASTASAVELALYDGSASRAVTRRAHCAISNPRKNAWNTCSFTAYTLDAGSQYWIGLLQPVSSTGKLQYREGRVTGGPGTFISKSTGLSVLPVSWKNGASWTGGYQASVFADQLVTAAPAPLPPLVPE